MCGGRRRMRSRSDEETAPPHFRTDAGAHPGTDLNIGQTALSRGRLDKVANKPLRDRGMEQLVHRSSGHQVPLYRKSHYIMYAGTAALWRQGARPLGLFIYIYTMYART